MFANPELGTYKSKKGKPPKRATTGIQSDPRRCNIEKSIDALRSKQVRGSMKTVPITGMVNVDLEKNRQSLQTIGAGCKLILVKRS